MAVSIQQIVCSSVYHVTSFINSPVLLLPSFFISTGYQRRPLVTCTLKNQPSVLTFMPDSVPCVDFVTKIRPDLDQ